MVPSRSPYYRTRYRRVQRFTPRSMIVEGESPSRQEPGVGQFGRVPAAAAAFVPDGMIFPRSDVTFFDVTVREASLPVNATTTRNVFTQEERIKGGWLRYIGYAFNNPHGFFQTRTTVLINGGTPSNYIFKMINAGATTYEGSLPTSQIGTIEQPASVFIFLPSNALVQIRFVNNSLTEAFSATVRLVGWSFGT